MAELKGPTSGDPITLSSDGVGSVPDHPIIPFIEGDGAGATFGTRRGPLPEQVFATTGGPTSNVKGDDLSHALAAPMGASASASPLGGATRSKNGSLHFARPMEGA